VKAVTTISSTEKLKVFIFGKDTNYWNIVGDSQKDTQQAWVIDVEVLAWKVTNDAMPPTNSVYVNRKFRVFLDSSKNIKVEDASTGDVNTMMKGVDMDTCVGMNINAVIAADQLSVDVTVNGTAGWMGSTTHIDGVGVHIYTAGTTPEAPSWSQAPQKQADTAITFKLKRVP